MFFFAGAAGSAGLGRVDAEILSDGLSVYRSPMPMVDPSSFPDRPGCPVAAAAASPASPVSVATTEPSNGDSSHAFRNIAASV